MSYDKSTIMSAITRIHGGDLVLPDIQRDFVWEPERIYKLLDSILRNYPFGTLLFWTTNHRVQYRQFARDWTKDQDHTFQIKDAGQWRTMVLDGQQRLQALYLAVFGSYEQKTLHFDLLSGVENDDVSEVRYRFEFLPAGENEARNTQNQGTEYWVPVRDIACLDDPSLLTLASQDYLDKAKIDAGSDAGKRLSQNLTNLFWKLNSAELLNYYTIGKSTAAVVKQPSLDEILEIFVRVNSGGQVLSKSDLMFSLMKLHWEGAYQAIAQLLDLLNTKGRFEFDKDFVLKCALVCCSRGARYDVSKLRDKQTLCDIKEAFERISKALIACLDFVGNTAKLQDGRILGSYNALIPFVYFLYQQSHQRPKDEATELAMSHALYLALMTGGFSHYADNRIDYVVQHILVPVHSSQPGVFPLAAIQDYIDKQEGHREIDDWLLQDNVPLLMNILEEGTLLPEGRRHYRHEYDHIFPKSKLEALRDANGAPALTREQVNHYANFRLLSKDKNIWKSNRDPQSYFSDHPEVLSRYRIPKQYLDYDHYDTFLEERRKLIWAQVRRFLGMSDGEASLTGAADNATTQAPDRSTGTAGGARPDTETQPPTPAERLAFIKLVLTRLDPSPGQRAVYRALYDAGEAGLTWPELCDTTGRTRREMMGTLGTLGRRINDTNGVDNFGRPGITLLLAIRREGEFLRYWLQPFFRQALDLDSDLRKRALGF